jgi:aminoglycoside 3-N-acetyltransferase
LKAIDSLPLLQQPITQESLLADLLALGLKTGHRVMVHAALSQIGWIAGGPEALIRALQRAVGPEGLIVMPTFNHGEPFSPAGVGYYDPRATPSASGRLSDVFWRQMHVLRSLSPTHPFAAWGTGAADVVSGHERTQTLGPDSPLGRLTERDGLLLHLGTRHEVSTVKHLAETMHGAKCLAAPPDHFPVRGPDGTITRLPTWRYRAAPCPLTEAGDHVTRRMAGLETVGRVGKARATLSSLAEVRDQVLLLLAEGAPPASKCADCTIGPSDRAEGDWG